MSFTSIRMWRLTPRYSFNQRSFTSALWESLVALRENEQKHLKPLEWELTVSASAAYLNVIYCRAFHAVYSSQMHFVKILHYEKISVTAGETSLQMKVQLELEASISKPHIYESNNRLLWYNPLLNIINRVILSKLSNKCVRLVLTFSLFYTKVMLLCWVLYFLPRVQKIFEALRHYRFFTQRYNCQ